MGGVQAELGPYCELRCTVWVHGLGNLQVFWFRAAPLTFRGVYLVPNTFLWEADIFGFVGFGWLVGQSCGFLVCLFVGCFFLSLLFFIWDVWISPLVVRKSLHCSTFICMYIWITSPQGQRIVFYISVQSEIILLVNINAGFIHPYFTLPSPGNDSTDIHSREVWGCLAPRRDWDISPKVQPLPNYLLM